MGVFQFEETWKLPCAVVIYDGLQTFWGFYARALNH